MTIDDQTKKLLNRIRGDMPLQGDGEKFVKFLEGMEFDALRQSKQKEDVSCRWKQGESMAYGALQKIFKESWEGR